MTTAQQARRCAQDFLDRQADATVAGDLEETLAGCDLPCTLESQDGRVVVTTQTQMRAICETFIAQIKARRLTHVIRTCLEAAFQDHETLLATYETRYLLNGTVLAEDPYPAFVILRHRDDRWKISAMQFAAKENSPANVALRTLSERARSIEAD